MPRWDRARGHTVAIAPTEVDVARWWWLLVAALAVTAELVTACSNGASRLERSADARAGRAWSVMSRERRGTALDMVRRVVDGDPSPAGPETPDPGADAIEALVAEGDRADGRIVLRITEREEGGPFSDPESTVRCYEYRLSIHTSTRPKRLDCPDVAALALPPPSPEPTIPGGSLEALEAALRPLAATNPSVADVLEAARAVGGDARVIDAVRVADAIGVAIGDGDDDCVFARLTRTGVEAWRVPPVLARPGELGCDPAAAAVGGGRGNPH